MQKRSTICAFPTAARNRSRWSRLTPRRRAYGTTTTHPHAQFSATLELNLGEVKPSLAGPKRPQDRVLLGDVGANYREALTSLAASRKPKNGAEARFANEGGATAVGHDASVDAAGQHVAVNSDKLCDGSVVIAAITSCTNTSNPAVMLGAGLLARNAVAKGLKVKPWVKHFSGAWLPGGD